MKINPERNAVYMKAETWTVFDCGGCEFRGFYVQGGGEDKSNAVDDAFEKGWRVIHSHGDRVTTNTLLCNQCFELHKRRDVRPALEALKQECEALCRCFCHTRDGLTICPDCESVHNSNEYQIRCPACGVQRVYIRGRYPGHDNRLICPQCVQGRLDDLTEESHSGQNAE